MISAGGVSLETTPAARCGRDSGGQADHCYRLAGGGGGRGDSLHAFELATAWRRTCGSGRGQASGVGGRVGAGTCRAMLSFPGSLKVFVAVEACDMRKGFNGLHALVTERLGEDLRQGALFVFSNRRHTRIKILCWDGTGLWVLTKRLERGTFSWPKHLEPQVTKLKLTPQALAMLTDGVDLRVGKMRPWYERDAA